MARILPLLLVVLVVCGLSVSGSQQAEASKFQLVKLQDSANLIHSESQLYLLGLFDLSLGDGCSQFDLDPNQTSWRRPMQNLEAFLWALERVNEEANQLLPPGVKLGSLVLDTCSSQLRTVMQLTQLLSAAPTQDSKLPQAHQLVAAINDIGSWPTLEASLRILQQVPVATFVTQSRSSEFARLAAAQSEAPPGGGALFRTATSNGQLADALTALMQHMNWTYLSVIYEDTAAAGDMLDLNEQLMSKLATSGLQVALNERLPVEAHRLDGLFRKLAARERQGARVVVSLVTPRGAHLLLEHLKTADRQEELSKLLWVSVCDREPYYAAGARALGTVLISSSSPPPEPFRLHTSSNSGNNRWWEAWRRASRQSEPRQPRGWEHNGVSVIDAVMIAARGLRRASSTAGCSSQMTGGGGDDHCSLAAIVRANLTGAPDQGLLADGSQLLGFAPNSGELVQNFKIYNLRHLQANSIGFVKFAEFNGRQGMRLNAGKARAYPAADDQPLASVRSQCLLPARGAHNRCASSSSSSSAPFQGSAPLASLNPPADSAEDQATQEVSGLYTMSSLNWSRAGAGGEAADLFNVIVLLPLHGNHLCSAPAAAAAPQSLQPQPQPQPQPPQQPLDMQAFQWMAGLAYALDQVNSAGPRHLTATLIDYCNREEARLRLAAHLEASAEQPPAVALLDFDSQLADSLQRGSLLAEEDLSHVTFDRKPTLEGAAGAEDAAEAEFVFPSELREMEALVELIERVGGRRWRMVHLVLTDADHLLRDTFIRLAVLRGVCVNKILSVPGAPPSSNQEAHREQVRQLLQDNFRGHGTDATRLLVVLGSRKPEINQLILEAASEQMLEHYVWVVNHNWIESVELEAERADFATRQLPVHLIGTRLEVLEDDQQFRSYLASLRPSAHQQNQPSTIPAHLLAQFWEQHFNCSLLAATCDRKLELDPQALDVDYRVPYIVKVIRELHAALQGSGADDFRPLLPASQLGGGGFDLVHRLLSVQTELSRRKQRQQQNSRRLVLDSNLPLVTVGAWRPLARLQLRPELEALGGGGGVKERLAGPHPFEEILESLEGLSMIESTCRSNRSCQACERQRQHETAISERERANSALEHAGSPQVVDWLAEHLWKSVDSGEPLASSAASLAATTVEAAAAAPATQHRRPAAAARYENGFSLAEAFVVSMLSLAGALLLLFAMAFLYPAALNRKQAGASYSVQASHQQQQLTGINDYFLFGGLLMLCSINVAYLLPATVPVCWFRRLGPASSYTVILSSMLVMVLTCYLKRWARAAPSKTQPQSNSYHHHHHHHQVEDEVELSFESLSHEHAAGLPRLPSSAHLPAPTAAPEVKHTGSGAGGASLLGLSLSLIGVQLLVSLAWCLKQAPEPSLYLGCWRCSPGFRTPLLYELLLSLVYPALLLLPTWLVSVAAFRRVSSDQLKFVGSHLSGPQQGAGTQSALLEIQRLKSQLRDARALVLTSTSLIILWSVVTLVLISAGPQRPPESLLVYANLLSAALVFLLLFGYRLRLLGSLGRCPQSALRKGHQAAIKTFSSSHNHHHRQPQVVLPGAQGTRSQELLRLRQLSGQRQYSTYAATASHFGGSSPAPTSGSLGRRRKRRRLLSVLGGGGGGAGGFMDSPEGGAARHHLKERSGLQRRQSSAASLASSTARLVFDESAGSVAAEDEFRAAAEEEEDINYLMDDAISYSSSVASSSTSQLQGNELYPLDYSIQLDAGQLVAGAAHTAGPHRHSLRRGASFRAAQNKLSAVHEETTSNQQQQQQQATAAALE